MLSLLARNPSQPQEKPRHAKMTGDRLTVGRSTENDLVLPDPEKYLSNRHCVLERRGHDYVLLDVSTNGTFLNYQPDRLDPAPTPLSQGDVILVGRFELVVDIKATVIDAPAADLPPLEDVRGPITENHGPTPNVDLLDPLADDDDAGDFLSDLLGGPDMPGTGGAIFDDGSSAPDHVPAASAHFAPPRTGGPMIPDDWYDSVLAPSSRSQDQDSTQPPSAARSVPPPPPELDADPQPRMAKAQGVKSAAARQSAPSAQTGAQDDAILRAFLDGIGAGDLNLSPDEAEEMMRRTGRIMATMIGGLRDILMTRAALKSEIRVDRTMISAQGNNPLKFSVSKEQAIEAMLKSSVPGYQEPELAVQEAMRDIKAHEIATMSGMEAALKDLLAQFAPDQLSERIAQQNSFAERLGSRKARAWDAYEKHYTAIASATENDFQSTFGKEFSRAYEAQIKKL